MDDIIDSILEKFDATTFLNRLKVRILIEDLKDEPLYQYVTLLDKKETDEWLCYEQGESYKLTWKLSTDEIVTVNVINHSSKHTCTYMTNVMFREQKWGYGEGDYINFKFIECSSDQVVWENIASTFPPGTARIDIQCLLIQDESIVEMLMDEAADEAADDSS